MKVSELWLRTLVNPPLSVTEIADQLTNAGIEVDSLEFIGAKADQGIWTFKIPPNRGDCLSMEGIAREVALLNNMAYQTKPIVAVQSTIDESISVHIEKPELCPRYLACVVKNINPTVPTPVGIKDRLEMAGLRSVSLLVDILNYVMLELGQPLHAFDLAKLGSEIKVRSAIAGEHLTLLDGQKIELIPETLVIADNHGVLALAGVMGGLHSAVSETTHSILIESAYFNPIAVRLAAKHYGIRTDSSFRFERGIDPFIQKLAIDRAVQLILETAGGQVGTVQEYQSANFMPKCPSVILKKARIQQLLGIVIPEETILRIFQLGNMQVQKEGDSFKVSPPSYRQDIALDVDLIEEIIRVYGLQHCQGEPLSGSLAFGRMFDATPFDLRAKQLLADRGYSEAITYSFTDPKWLEHFHFQEKPLALSNPITVEMAVMRTSLWPGLLQAVQYNQRRQSARVRLFEIGVCFKEFDGSFVEKSYLSGVVAGTLQPEQWGVVKTQHDFYDLKGDLEAILGLIPGATFTFAKGEHAALHPSQTAKILMNQQTVGVIGSLHPQLLKSLDLEGPLSLFEIDLERVQIPTKVVFQSLSKFPAIRRDLAVLIEQTVWVSDLKAAIYESVGQLLEELIIFDVYQGKGIDPTKKSIAIGLILRHSSRTLVEDEVSGIIQRVVAMLSSRFGAILRE